MSWNANESTIKFAQACIDKDLDTVHNLLRINKEKIDVKQLDEMKTLLKTVGPFRIFPSLERLQEEMENDPGEEVIKALCEIGVDLEQKDDYGQTALYLALRGSYRFHANSRIVKILLEHGASVHAKDSHGRTPLLEACKYGNLEVVQMLIQYHADVNARDGGWRTPLHYACSCKNLEIVQLLIQHNADVEARDMFGSTPLHYACSEEIVEELLKHKADINALCTRAESIKMTPLMCAAEMGYSDVVQEFLHHGADVDFKDANVGNALHFAMQHEYENVDTVKVLLKHGCTINVQAKLTVDDEELPMCTAFELALNFKSINSVKTIAYHQN